jgi:hypothetical protein
MSNNEKGLLLDELFLSGEILDPDPWWSPPHHQAAVRRYDRPPKIQVTCPPQETLTMQELQEEGKDKQQ